MTNQEAIRLLKRAAQVVPPASTTGAPMPSPNATTGLPGFLAKGPMSLQVQPGIGSEGAQQGDPAAEQAALEAQKMQQEAEMSANEASMKAQQESQKLELENAKLKMEAQQAQQEAAQAKQEAQLEKQVLDSQKAIAQAEHAKMKAEQDLLAEKAKTSQQSESLKTLQEKAKLQEIQKDVQSERAVQQATMQAEQAKMQANAQTEQAKMQQQDTASKSQLQQLMSQHEAQKAQSGAELMSRENQLGLKEKAMQQQAKAQAAAPQMHPSAVKLAKYASRMQRGSKGFFFKSGTQGAQTTPEVKPVTTPEVRKPMTPKPQLTELSRVDKLMRSKPVAKVGDAYDKWMAEGVGMPTEARFWNDTTKYKAYDPRRYYLGMPKDIGQGLVSMVIRNPLKNFVRSGELAREGDYGAAAGRFALGTAEVMLTAAGFGAGKLAAGAGKLAFGAGKLGLGGKIAPRLAVTSKLGRGGAFLGGAGVSMYPEAITDSDRSLLAQREAIADRMLAATEAEAKRNSPSNLNNYRHIPADIRAQYVNRYGMQPIGGASWANNSGNYEQPSLFSFETLANILSGLLTGGLQNRNMLSQRAPYPQSNYIQDSLGQYVNQVRQPQNPYNPYQG